MKKSVWRGIYILVCLMVIAGFTSAMGQGKKITITYYDMPDQIKFAEWGIKRFVKENPDVHIEMLASPDPSTYWDKLQVMFAAGEAPDMYGTNPGGILLTHAKNGLLRDLTPYYEEHEEVFKDWTPRSIEWIKLFGKHWQVTTHGTVGYFLWYNKTMFEKAGIKLPTGDWTFYDFYDAVVRLTMDKDGDGKMDQWGHARSWWSWLTLVRGEGGRLLSDDLRKCLLNSPQAIESLEWQQRLAFEEAAIPSGISAMGGGRSAYFGGRAASTQGTASHLAPVLDVKWEPALVPMPNGKAGRFPLGTAHCVVITKSCEHPDEAFEYLTYLCDYEAQVAAVREFGWVSSVSKVNEEYLGKSPGVNYPPGFKEIVIETVGHPNASLPPRVPAEAEQEIISAQQKIFLQDAPVKQIVEDLVPKVNKLLQEFWK
ncbi:hypothetical protein ES703_33682 [subsurface metagenome]